ncbi:GTPase [Gramella jeungdoensis]|uniref:GTPase n=1 Tax=Gramella jeungdoensis TaxID=708091 RepID=A0ABT0YWQ0_9FLAO|nr:GTPase [Gramella jeungdoensis]MCM8567866.1 GTPase [Gramella jeungdoensis]
MEKLIFVYNADSGRLNGFMDSLHKTIRPSTYNCKLCKLTFGVLHQKKDWKNFMKGLNAESEFLHKNEFQKQYASKFGYKFEFPLILMQNRKGLEVFLSKDEFWNIDSLEELMKVIRKRLNS